MQKRALAERAAKKRLLVSIGAAKAMRLAHKKRLLQLERERESKKLALEEKIRNAGMAGMKLGKHAVPEGQVEVQLGEELSESLRALKVRVQQSFALYLLTIICLMPSLRETSSKIDS